MFLFILILGRGSYRHWQADSNDTTTNICMKCVNCLIQSFSSVQVHALYRTTGASFEKAQQEFATGVMSNKTVQTAAANAAANAASNAARGAFRP